MNLPVQAQQGKDLQVALEDLTPDDRVAFEAELASGALARLVLPWEPWWRSGEAQRLSLSGAGTRLIQDPAMASSGIRGHVCDIPATLCGLHIGRSGQVAGTMLIIIPACSEPD